MVRNDSICFSDLCIRKGAAAGEKEKRFAWRRPQMLFLVCFFSSTFMRSLPVVKKALIVFHQCCMRSAASAAAAVAPIVSSFCLFSAKKEECLNHRGILKLKYRAASVAGVMTRGWACVVRKRIRFLFCFGAKKKNKTALWHRVGKKCRIID